MPGLAQGLNPRSGSGAVDEVQGSGSARNLIDRERKWVGGIEAEGGTVDHQPDGGRIARTSA
jgi:hypothetical protein